MYHPHCLYRLWCQRRTDPDGLWSQLTYQPRRAAECERLLDIYEEQWGQHYRYRIVLDRHLPGPVECPV